MSSAGELLQQLLAQVGAVYPARIAELSRHTGQVAAVITPTRCEYETGAMCSPVPMRLTAEIELLAGSGGQSGVVDLISHVDAVAVLIRAAGWEPDEWQPNSVDDQPAITITATADGDG